jgi:hypothetical protein
LKNQPSKRPSRKAMAKAKRAALYVRVSTDSQTVENQSASFGKWPSGVAGR